jgi:uncharacterized protein
VQLLDVNVLVRAYNADDPEHAQFRGYLDRLLDGDRLFACSDLALSGFIRIVTFRSASRTPLPKPVTADEALAFVEALRTAPTCTIVAPGERHWQIFSRLCRNSRVPVHGRLVPDAYFAAMAIENEWVTADRDYQHFPGLSWRLLPQDQVFTNPT